MSASAAIASNGPASLQPAATTTLRWINPHVHAAIESSNSAAIKRQTPSPV